MSGGTGGPADSTMFYTLYLYLKGFGSFEMGYASAMAWFLLVQREVMRRLEETGAFAKAEDESKADPAREDHEEARVP